MTDVDTAAILARFRYGMGGHVPVIHDLCHALDAAQKTIARYEVSQQQTTVILNAKHEEMRAAQARAETAERHAREERALRDDALSNLTAEYNRAEAAEARATTAEAEAERLKPIAQGALDNDCDCECCVDWKVEVRARLDSAGDTEGDDRGNTPAQ